MGGIPTYDNVSRGEASRLRHENETLEDVIRRHKWSRNDLIIFYNEGGDNYGPNTIVQSPPNTVVYQTDLMEAPEGIPSYILYNTVTKQTTVFL
jgi:hypothetical protein